MNPGSIIDSIIADTLDLDEDIINGDMSVENTANWDSMAHLTLVTAIESEFSIKLTMDEIQSVNCVRDLHETVLSHLDAQ